MRIQHNIAALNSHRQLGNNNSAVSKNLEKLSSGYKINRAGDDAAGLAISEKMRAQITGLETAKKNANDGISLVQTAEGALTEVHSMLNRMVELANQSSNGTFDEGVDRANLQEEMDALKLEIDRISEGTNFNGINLLDGSMSGAKDTASITIGGYNITGLDTAVKKVEFVSSAGTGTDPNAAITGITISDDGVLTITGTAGGGTGTMTVSNADLQAALENAGYAHVTVGGTPNNFGAIAAADTAVVAASAATVGGNIRDGFKINFTKGETGLDSIEITATPANGAHGATNTDGAIAIQLDETKLYTKDDINKMLKDVGAGAMTVDFSGTISGAEVANGLGVETAQTITDGTGIAGAGTGMSLQIGDTSDSFNQLSFKVDAMDSKSLGLQNVDISSQANAQKAVDAIKQGINSVSSARGNLGAIQNRLEHTINNLSVTAENMTAAESRIRDVDMAQEMMTFTKNNILTQASQAMLAQANQIPQGVLQLLQ